MSLAKGQGWPALAGAAGALALGALGLLRAYRGTMRFYQGQYRVRTPSGLRAGNAVETTPAGALDRSEGNWAKPTKDSTKAIRGERRTFLEWRLPWVSNQSAALALASFRSMLRAPETKMGLVMPILMILIFGSMLLRRSQPAPLLLEPLVPTGLAFLILFGLLQIALNQFGYDRDGFRALILLPVARKRVLLAKNLALLGLSLGIQLVMAILLVLFKRFPADALAAGVIQFLIGFLLLSLMGNWASIIAPYRVAHGTLKRNRTGKSVLLVVLFIHLIFPLAMIPIFMPPAVEILLRSFGFPPAVPVSLLLSVLLLGLTWLVYQSVLNIQGRHLQRREKDILQVVTQEVE